MDKYRVIIEVKKSSDDGDFSNSFFRSEVMASNEYQASEMCLLEARWNNPDCSKGDFKVLDTVKLTRTHIKKLG